MSIIVARARLLTKSRSCHGQTRSGNSAGIGRGIRLGIEFLEERTLLSVGPATGQQTLAAGPLADVSAPVSDAVAARGTETAGQDISSCRFQYHHLCYDPATGAAIGSATSGASPTDASPFGTTGPTGLTPQQILAAYGIDSIVLGSVVGDGTGQTIAIVDAYNNPRFVSSTDPNFLASDLHLFDAQFGLPDPPSFTKLDQNGGTSYPAGNTGWGTEIALDVEWAHAIAPKANIVLVEAASNTTTDLFAAINTARNLPGVTAVSMSFGSDGEYSDEITLDSTFTTPTGHAGVTFLASTGDDGAPGGYPAYSPNVVAVGGTHLTLSGSSYGSESGWSGSGGGQSSYEIEQLFQDTIQTSGRRQIPDVSFDADPNTGVAVYDSYSQGTAAPWIMVGGTSLSAPCWAGLVAIANQLRTYQGTTSLNGRWQTLPALYSLSSNTFHDVTTGANGYVAGPGYDMVTGRGSPVANLLVPALASTTAVLPTTLYSATMDTDPGWTFSGGQWAWGTPTGGAGDHGAHDPTSGHTGTKVVGYNLSGGYANSLYTTYYATTPAINCSAYSNVTLSFWRWLGVEQNYYDHASIEVSTDGASWSTIWQNGATTVDDGKWAEQSYDLSSIADGQAMVYVRWSMGPTDSVYSYCGWNIDDVMLQGLPRGGRPTVASVTSNLVTIADTSAGAAALTLTLGFNQPMDTSVRPTITIESGVLSSTLVFNAAQSAWSNNTTFVAKYDVVDVNAAYSYADAWVAGGQDLLGRRLLPRDFPDVLSVDMANPTINTLSPSDNSTGVDRNTNLVMNFWEFVQKGSGSILIRKASDNSIAETIDVASPQVTVSNWTVTIDPSIILQGSTDYYVQIAAGAIKDSAGNNYAGIGDTTTWSFSTTVPVVDHFEFSTVGNHSMGEPFSVTVTAKDVGGATVTGFNGTANLSGFVGSGDGGGTVELLSFIKYTNVWTGSKYKNTIQAIASQFSNFHETTTTATDPAALAAALAGKDVFLVPAEDNLQGASLDALGTSWTTVLNNFVSAGGVVIVCSSFMGQEHLILNNSGLLSLAVHWSYGSASFTKTADTVLNAGVSVPFNVDDYWGVAYDTATNGLTSLQLVDGGYPAVLSRNVGFGHAVMIGGNYGTIGSQLDKVIANAVKWGQDIINPVPITPTVTGNFVNGLWTGSIIVNQAATGMRLRADDAYGHSGKSNTFDVLTATVTTSVTPSLATIADANAGQAAFSLTTTFNEAMNTAVAPTIAFPVEDPSRTLVFNSGTSGWTNSTTYLAKYDVLDANISLANVDVRVSGAQSAAGRSQIQGDFADRFSIDTQNPTVQSLSPADDAAGIDRAGQPGDEFRRASPQGRGELRHPQIERRLDRRDDRCDQRPGDGCRQAGDDRSVRHLAGIDRLLRPDFRRGPQGRGRKRLRGDRRPDGVELRHRRADRRSLRLQHRGQPVRRQPVLGNRDGQGPGRRDGHEL